MASNTSSGLFSMPLEFEKCLHNQIQHDQVLHVADLLQSCHSMTCWEDIANFCFRLDPANIENIKYDKHTRTNKILSTVQKWWDIKQEQATYATLMEILDERNLVSIKQRWWMKFAAANRRQNAEEKIRMIEDHCLKLADPCCSALTSDQWKSLFRLLKVDDVELNDNLRSLNIWVERNGYDHATINSLDSMVESMKAQDLQQPSRKRKGRSSAAKRKRSKKSKNFVTPEVRSPECIPRVKVGMLNTDNSGDLQEIFSMPSEIQSSLSCELSDNDVQFIATVLNNMKSFTCKDFAQIWLTLSNYECSESSQQVEDLSNINQWRDLLTSWRGRGGATLDAFIKVLDDAKLTGIKQLWWREYKSPDEREYIDEIVEEQNEIFKKLINCGILPQEWTDFLKQLDIHDKERSIHEMNKYNTLEQRLNMLIVWREKFGFEKATIKTLKSALKKARLRRVHSKIAENSMIKKFEHFLEDEWDNVFHVLNDEQLLRILEKINRDLSTSGQWKTKLSQKIDDGFDCVIRDGYNGFYRFINALFVEIHAPDLLNKLSLSKLFKNPMYVKLFEVKHMWPVVPHFHPTKDYENVVKTIQSNHWLLLRGLPGSGKTQCVSKYAEEFEKKHPLSIIWFIHLKRDYPLIGSLTSLHKALTDAGIHTPPPLHEQPDIGSLIRDVRKCKLPVLFVVDNLDESNCENEMLMQLLQCLKNYKNAFVIATTQIQDSALLKSFFQEERVFKGFETQEVKEFLSKDAGTSLINDENNSNIERVVIHYNHLPLGLAPFHAYCSMHGTNVKSFLSLLEKYVTKLHLEPDEETYLVKNCGSEHKEYKSIISTMVLCLESLRNYSVLGYSVDLRWLFSYTRFFHHKNIPLYLFKQLILLGMYAKESLEEGVLEILEAVLTTMLTRFERSALCVVKYNKKDFYKSSISIHKIAQVALNCSMFEQTQDVKNDMLLDALQALLCYFQKDNRNQEEKFKSFLPLFRHVTKVLVLAKKRDQEDKNNIFREILIIKLLELKGFACTQCYKPNEAAGPLKEAHDRLLEYLQVENVTITSDENEIRRQAKDIYMKCEEALRGFQLKYLDKLLQTVIINEDTQEVIKRNWKESITFSNDPLDRKVLKILRMEKLSTWVLLPQAKLKKIYLAGVFASILHTRGRLFFYDGYNGKKEEHWYYLKLAQQISEEVSASTGINILHKLISVTNGLLYFLVNDSDKSDEEKQDDYNRAYQEYNRYLNDDKNLYYEHGILKEDGKTPLNRMRYLSQMIKVSKNTLELRKETEMEEKKFEDCKLLMDLVKEHPECPRGDSMRRLINAAEFCQLAKKWPLAIEIYRKVLEDTKDEIEKYKDEHIRATIGYAETILVAIKCRSHGITSSQYLEAKSACSRVALLPRIEDRSKLNSLVKELDLNWPNFQEEVESNVQQ